MKPYKYELQLHEEGFLMLGTFEKHLERLVQLWNRLHPAKKVRVIKQEGG